MIKKIINPIISISFLLFFICLSLKAVQAEDKILLKYNFQKGAQLNYQMRVDGEVAVEVIPEEDVPASKNFARIKGNFDYSHKITEYDANTKAAVIEINYGKSQMDTIVNDRVIPNADVARLEGKVATVKVAEDGEVIDFILPQGLPASMQNADFKNMFAAFPKRALRVGESWMKNSEAANDENENFNTKNIISSTYTLLAVEKKGKYQCAKVKFESVTNTITTSKKAELFLDGKVEGRVEGVVYYDLEKGNIVFSELNTKISNKVRMGGQASPGNVNQKAVTTIVDTDLKTIVELL
ncbi:MAG: hypothetical protein HY810_09775 [Candidatus Omnitrophica bacterium]|nr:hypothetical protein [Candidatus Omnitrophota bacterium]